MRVNHSLLTLLVASIPFVASLPACAAQPDDSDLDNPATTTAETDAPRTAACDAPELGSCVTDDDIALCTGASIKYEYEMLDARQRGDRSAFDCHRRTLLGLTEHACGLGDAPACELNAHVQATDGPG